MCGIVYTTNPSLDVRGALQVQQHRGKDYTGYERVGAVQLGHNRLAIQDLRPESNQPMLRRNAYILFNGELWDGYQRFREELGCTTCGDTEVLLLGYLQRGIEFLHSVEGMYATVIHTETSTVFFRDWVGKMPLHYSFDNGYLTIASEIKSLVYLGCKNIQDVLPGRVYEYKNGELTQTPFSSIPEELHDEGADAITTTIRAALTEGVRKRMISDVPICTILSGGVDSLLITYLLKQLYPQLEAFVVSVGDYKGRRKDDLYYARKSAEFLNIPLNEVILPHDYEKDTEKIRETVYAAESFSWTQIAPAMVQIPLARAISEKGFKVVFGGEGSDEIFGSYGHIQRWAYEGSAFNKARRNALLQLYKTNLIRANKAMMYGGTVELRVPFLDKAFVDYCITLDTKYAFDGRQMKPMLRKAFLGQLPEELLMRPKVVFHKGAHSDLFLKEQTKADRFYLKRIYDEVFHQG